MITKLFSCHLAAAAAVLLFAGGEARAVSFDFSSVAGAKIAFNGVNDTFAFVNDFSGSAGRSFSINLSDTPELMGLTGYINGTFQIGTISTFGGLQTAAVTNSGQFVIVDGAGAELKGAILWEDLYTLGIGGAINTGGSFNLTGITYTGLNQGLITLQQALNNEASVNATFQFNPAKSLTTLTTQASNTTTFSGSVYAVNRVPDGGSAVALLGIALVGVEGLRRKLKLS